MKCNSTFIGSVWNTRTIMTDENTMMQRAIIPVKCENKKQIRLQRLKCKNRPL